MSEAAAANTTVRAISATIDRSSRVWAETPESTIRASNSRCNLCNRFVETELHVSVANGEEDDGPGCDH